MLGQGPAEILHVWSHVSGICVLCCVVVGGLVVCVCVGGGAGWPGGYSCTELGEGGFSR